MFLALRHALCTRLLFTGISSHLYHPEGWTIDDLMTEFTKQALDAYHKGCCDSWIVYFSMEQFYNGPPMAPSHILVARAFVLQDIDGTRIRLVWIGCKGDWPFLRKELLLRLALWVSLVPKQWNKYDSQHFLVGTQLPPAQAFNLSTGFTSKRICHRCTAKDNPISKYSYHGFKV